MRNWRESGSKWMDIFRMYSSVGVGMRPPLPTTTATTNLTKIKWKDKKKKRIGAWRDSSRLLLPSLFCFSGFSLPSFPVCVLPLEKSEKKNGDHKEHISFKWKKKRKRKCWLQRRDFCCFVLCLFFFGEERRHAEFGRRKQFSREWQAAGI